MFAVRKSPRPAHTVADAQSQATPIYPDDSVTSESPHSSELSEEKGIDQDEQSLDEEISGKRTGYSIPWDEKLIISGLHHYSRAHIQELLAVITPFADNGVQDAIKNVRQDHGAVVPTEVLHRVQQWLASKTSTLLWVEGQVFPSDFSPLALRVCSVLLNSSIPCISFFNRRRYHNPWKLEVSQAGVVCLLYTLIQDLVYQLPSVVTSEIVMEAAYFAPLDGSWASTKHALDMISQFFSYLSSGMVIVINGLEVLDDKETRKVLKELIDIIRDQGSKTTLKTIFLTNGMSQALGMKAIGAERVDASRFAVDRPTRPLRGGSSLSELQAGRSSADA